MDKNKKAQFNSLQQMLYAAQGMLFAFEDANKSEITPDAQERLDKVETIFERLLEEMSQVLVRL